MLTLVTGQKHPAAPNMPSRWYCAAEGCHADTLKRGKYGYMANVTFFPFPTKKKDPRTRKKWLELLRREDYDPPRHHRLCSQHFVDGEPTKANPFPTLFRYNNFKEGVAVRSTNAMEKRAMHSRIHMPEELAEIPDSQPDSPKDFRLHPIDIVRKLFTNIAFIN